MNDPSSEKLKKHLEQIAESHSNLEARLTELLSTDFNDYNIRKLRSKISIIYKMIATMYGFQKSLDAVTNIANKEAQIIMCSDKRVEITNEQKNDIELISKGVIEAIECDISISKNENDFCNWISVINISGIAAFIYKYTNSKGNLSAFCANNLDQQVVTAFCLGSQGLYITMLASMIGSMIIYFIIRYRFKCNIENRLWQKNEFQNQKNSLLLGHFSIGSRQDLEDNIKKLKYVNHISKVQFNMLEALLSKENYSLHIKLQVWLAAIGYTLLILINILAVLEI